MAVGSSFLSPDFQQPCRDVEPFDAFCLTHSEAVEILRNDTGSTVQNSFQKIMCGSGQPYLEVAFDEGAKPHSAGVVASGERKTRPRFGVDSSNAQATELLGERIWSTLLDAQAKRQWALRKTHLTGEEEWSLEQSLTRPGPDSGKLRGKLFGALHSTNSSPATAIAIPTTSLRHEQQDQRDLPLPSVARGSGGPSIVAALELRTRGTRKGFNPHQDLRASTPTPPTPRQPTPPLTLDIVGAFLGEGNFYHGSNILLPTLRELQTTRLHPRNPSSFSLSLAFALYSMTT